MRGKVIGLLIGTFFGGPLGALLGLWLGHKWDKRRRAEAVAMRYRSGNAAAVAAVAAVVALAAKVAKADGHVAADEIRVFRRVVPIPPHQVATVTALWEEARRSPEGYEPYARHLAELFHGQPAMLERVLALLSMVAAADGVTSPEERRALRRTAEIFGLSDSDIGLGIATGAFAPGPVQTAELERAFRDMFDGRLVRSLEAPGARLFTRLQDGLRAACATPAGRWLTVAAMALAAGLVAYGQLPGFLPFDGPPLGIAIGLAAAIAAYYWLPRPRKDGLHAMLHDQRIDSEEVAGAIRETTAKIGRIRQDADLLDPPVRDRVDAICDLAACIVAGFRADPGDIGRSRPFLNHYLDATRDVVSRYADLRRREPQAARFAEVRAKLEPLLADMEKMFEDHYDRIVAENVRDLDMSIETLRRVIRAEGR